MAAANLRMFCDGRAALCAGAGRLVRASAHQAWLPVPQCPAPLPLLRQLACRASGDAGAAVPSSAPQVTAAMPEVLSQLDAQQMAQVDAFLDVLLQTNENLNLTAVRNRDDALVRHVADCLALLPVIEGEAQGGELRVVDVGTGGGLPGIIFAIARPGWRVTLLDSLQKRCAFLEGAAAQVGLSNVDVLWTRAEEAGRSKEHRESYDVAVARAVAEQRVLAELCLPLVRVGGIWVAAKGPKAQEEVEAARNALGQLGGKLVGVTELQAHGQDAMRTAIVVAKAKPTPPQFPRRPGMPNKRPL